MLNLLMKEPNEIWSEIKMATIQAAEAYIPKLKRKKKTPWISENAIKIAEERRISKVEGADGKALKNLTVIFKAR